MAHHNLHPFGLIHGNPLHSYFYPFIFNPNDPTLNAQLNFYHYNQRNPIFNQELLHQSNSNSHLAASNNVQDPETQMKKSHQKKLKPKQASSISKNLNHRQIQRMESRIANSFIVLREYLGMHPHISSFYGNSMGLSLFFETSPKSLKHRLIQNALWMEDIMKQTGDQNLFHDTNVIAFAKALIQMIHYEKGKLEWNEFLKSGELNLFENYDEFNMEKDQLSNLVPLPPPKESLKSLKSLHHSKSTNPNETPILTAKIRNSERLTKFTKDANYISLNEFWNANPILFSSGNLPY